MDTKKRRAAFIALAIATCILLLAAICFKACAFDSHNSEKGTAAMEASESSTSARSGNDADSAGSAASGASGKAGDGLGAGDQEAPTAPQGLSVGSSDQSSGVVVIVPDAPSGGDSDSASNDNGSVQPGKESDGGLDNDAHTPARPNGSGDANTDKPEWGPLL